MEGPACTGLWVGWRVGRVPLLYAMRSWRGWVGGGGVPAVGALIMGTEPAWVGPVGRSAGCVALIMRCGAGVDWSVARWPGPKSMPR